MKPENKASHVRLWEGGLHLGRRGALLRGKTSGRRKVVFFADESGGGVSTEAINLGDTKTI